MEAISGKLGAEGLTGFSRRIAFAKVHRWENKVIRLISTLIKKKWPKIIAIRTNIAYFN